MSLPIANSSDANATSPSVGQTEGQTAGAFAASLVTAIVIFSVQVVLFLLIKDRFARIYAPRTYLVPEKERTNPADPGLWKWIKPVLKTSNSEFVQKCGLDAYFFLRYLRTLLKIFVPAALIILPVLLPLNAVDGRGTDFAVGKYANETNVTGLDQLAWGNVRPDHSHRYWAHWLLAVSLILWACYIIFDELRGYIRMRQAYLTSPQHRLRASATTVLVGSIPHKWCNVEALDGLFDVFPGGLRNIWINRNFDELSAKIKKRDELAKELESAETKLIKLCRAAHEKQVKKAAKAAGKRMTSAEKKQRDAERDENARLNAQGHGISSGNPHQVHHTVEGALANNSDYSEDSSDSEGEIRPDQARRRKKPIVPIPLVGEGVQAVTAGINKLHRNVLGGLRKAEKDVNSTINTTNGYVPPDPEGDAVTAGAQPDFYLAGKQTSTIPSRRKTGAAPENMPAAQDTLQGQRAAPPSEVDNTRPSGESAFTRARDSEQRDQRALTAPSPTPYGSASADKAGTVHKNGLLNRLAALVGFGDEEKEPVEYPEAFNAEFDKDSEDAAWKKYIRQKDRQTMRLPIFGWGWMPSLPLMGQKVDTIYYCREHVARLNAEIEEDQAHPERFPLMNSAFVQFNHQVAAHMACQSLSHHLPKQMAPRLVEISPNDVIWDNMSIPWWQRYIRTSVVASVVAAMVVLWAVPVAFTSALSQLKYAAEQYAFLKFITRAPEWVLAALQGVLPPALLALLMFLLPLFLRLLARFQGHQSGMLVELSVQKYYFFFLFVQLFLIVSIAGAITVLSNILNDVNEIRSIPNLLAQNVPKASNYFFSYMLLQAMSVSAGALVQIGALVGWFILAPIFDSTARSKFKRQTNLAEVKWGTFFPVYTNLAVIGLIYSVISPLILVFNVITFSLFWFVYRYNTLYVTKFTRDTGGLLYPNALNLTFVGLYFMEIVLIALFFLVRDENNEVACKGQGIGMAVVLVCTVVYQILLNEAFSPLFRYLPITLEDDAVRRDEEFQRALNKKHGILEDDEDNESLQHALEERERREREEDRLDEEIELRQIDADKRKSANQPASVEYQNPEISLDANRQGKIHKMTVQAAKRTANLTVNRIPTINRKSWADRENNRRSVNFGQYPSPHPSTAASRQSSRQRVPPNQQQQQHQRRPKKDPLSALAVVNNFNPLLGNEKQLEEAQAARNQLSDALFGGIHDELEDLTPEQRDGLVQRAFQHAALRARRPVIWLPRDEIGVSDDEINRMANYSQYLWVSNVRQGLDAKGRCVYSGAPPDFSEVDLVEL